VSAINPAAADLERLVESFARRRVAVLGDFVADEFVHGDIARISREAPVLILEHRETAVVPGGGANAVVNLRALGATPVPVGVVGKDASGHALVHRFRELGIPTSGIVTVPGYETPTKSRVVAGGVHTRRQQIVRIDRGATPGRLAPKIAASLRQRLRKALGRAAGLLIADYGYGAGAPDVVGRSAKHGARPVTVDSRMRVEQFRNVTACTPNQEEVERALGLGPLLSLRSVEDAGRRLLRRSGNESILLTRGAQGMSLFRRGRPVIHIPAFGCDEVADVTGAGDTVIAVFTLALISGGDYFEAALLANYAAGVVVMKAGTATVNRAELIEAIREDRQ
jgi:rfaE bifunctional protein kinase chain/domain